MLVADGKFILVVANENYLNEKLKAKKRKRYMAE
jgi:hypothetical protein